MDLVLHYWNFSAPGDPQRIADTPRAQRQRARWLADKSLSRQSISAGPAATSAGRTVARFDHAVLDKVVDQRRCAGSEVLRHGSAGQLAVVLGQRRQHPAMVFDGLVWPAGDGGKHG